MSADERKAYIRLVEVVEKLPFYMAEKREIISATCGMAEAMGRNDARKRSDKRTEKNRRKTVGVRVPVYFYNRCKAAADKMEVSLYAFTMAALELACEKAEKLLEVPGAV